MIDLWFRQDLKSILDTKSVAVFVDESELVESNLTWLSYTKRTSNPAWRCSEIFQ